ncbi:unnamed protein product, partial [Prorocentrum cordatum]
PRAQEAEEAVAPLATPSEPPRARTRPASNSLASMAATGGVGMPGVLKLVVQAFLEEEHYKTLYRVLAEQWHSCHSLTAAMRLMEAHGVKITKEEEMRLLEFDDESRMIDALVTKMPQQSREQFEHFFLQLSFIASTTKRMREALQ